MALPTIPNYWTTRKNIYEQAIVKKRIQDDDFRQKWSNTADYFHKSDVEVNKQRVWESDKSFQDSMDAYRIDKEKERKQEKLKQRRERLAVILKRERDEYEAELRGYSKENFARIEEMKERADGLKSAREEKRKHIAEEKLYEHWRQNNPDIRKIESNQMKTHVIDGWGDQVTEHQEQIMSARREKAEADRLLEEERQAALQLQRDKEEEKLMEEKKFRQILKQQMMELRSREREAEQLKIQEEALLRHQWELEQMEEERRARDDARKKMDLGRVLLRQHKAQMLRRSRQIMEELEQDRRILGALIEKGKEEEVIHTARREKARADAAWMKKVIDEQIRLEKAREAELDSLFQEEAARVWQEREAEWEKERMARERLMQEVMDDRQAQIDDKMEEVKRQQEESLERREELIREMEIANRLTKRDAEQEEEAKRVFRDNLKEQATARRERELTAKQRMEEELMEEKMREEEYEELLRQETERMRLQGYQPKDHAVGRKQAWM